MAIIVTTFCWGDAYGDHYVRRLSSGVWKNLRAGHKFICFTDRARHLPKDIAQHDIRDRDLLEVKGCFARLRLFDQDWLGSFGVKPGDKVINLDLDLLVVGELDPLFEGDADFTILQGINTTNPCPYNGSAWMFKAGSRPDVWNDFSLDAASKIPYHAFPDDQGWFWHKIPDAAKWGPDEGVYGFKKRGWGGGEALPANARMVAFPGWRDPAKFEHLNWVKQNWR